MYPTYHQTWDGIAASYAEWNIAGSTSFSVGTPNITSGAAALQLASPGANRVLSKTAVEASADGTLSFYFKGSAGGILGGLARLQAASLILGDQRCYCILVVENGASSDLYIQYYPGGGGAATSYGPVACTMTAADIFLAELRIQGTTLTARLRDRTSGMWLQSSGTFGNVTGAAATAITQVDANIAAAGRLGLVNAGTGSTYPEQIDDVYFDPAVPVLDNSTLSLNVGGATGTLTAGGFSDPLAGVTWTTSNAAVATVAGGVVTAVGVGTCTITATGQADSAQTATCTVTVTNPTATSYTLTDASPASGYVANASGNFTVRANGTPSVALVVTPNDGGSGGTFAPTSLTITDALAHTFTYTPSTTPGAKTIGATHTGGGFAGDPGSVTYTALARTLALAPASLATSATTTATFSGGGTKWTASAPTFAPTGLAGVRVGSVTVVSDTSATAPVTTGSASGTATFTDSTTSATAPATVATTRTIVALAPYGVAFTGLTLGYTIYNTDGTTYQAHATTGVVEIAGTGIYLAPVFAPTTIAGVLAWDAPTGVDPYVREIEPQPTQSAGVGSGSVAVTQDSGGTDNLTYLGFGGTGIGGATVRAYLASDWTANPATAPVRGETQTLSSGRWAGVMMLDPGSYTFVFWKPGATGTDTKTVAIS